MTQVLPDAYRGDSYSFRLTFPDASYLAGSPGDVLAQIRKKTDSPVLATWSVSVDGASLVLTLAAVTLPAGEYLTDVQVGSTTYLRRTTFRVLADVSRPS